MISHLLSCIRGPRVYRVYTANENELSQPYGPNPLEHGGQQIIKGVSVLANIGLYVSPMVLLYLWRKDYTIEMACVSIAKLTAGFTLLVLVSMVIRGIGRSVNPSYSAFLTAKKEADIAHLKAKLSHSILASKYDCDFSALPISYESQHKDRSSIPFSIFHEYFTFSGLVSHLFGRHLIYPGSIQLLQVAIGVHLEEGRTNLMTKNGGKRAKVLAGDGNEIDTVFVDRRDRNTPVGSTLVLCCEGNAGFYEVGIMTTPLNAGYSVLGWNMPGFAYSTGLPFPRQVQEAADGVMQYAINSLGFTPDNILVFGWSIGGYPASWLAMHYPDVRGLIMDATFDHVLPLALPRMPPFMSGLVEHTIRGHFNLCNGEQTVQYSGPITVVRRKDDEIITTVEGDISTNRANHLLEMILRHRYPLLFCPESEAAMTKFFKAKSDSEKSRILHRHSVSSEEVLPLLREVFVDDLPSFPSLLGAESTPEDKTRVLLFLVTKMLVDVDGGHPNPLDARVFKQPWSVVADTSYVQVE